MLSTEKAPETHEEHKLSIPNSVSFLMRAHAFNFPLLHVHVFILLFREKFNAMKIEYK